MKRHIAILSTILFISLASCNKKAESAPEETEPTVETTTPSADTVAEAPAPKIERPSKSVVETSLDTKLLFNTWVSDPEGPHADFVLSPKSFYVVDYDGNGDMPYILKGNKLTIYYEDSVQEVDILSVSKSKLVLKWHEIEEPVTYEVWKG
ncbi:MAG: hypothetical protein DI539_07530 [Flavobacterium psychrophilum]|nr:MAG: hypothetical protein DI539_07530 [Flavobacterium psychrophilum]